MLNQDFGGVARVNRERCLLHSLRGLYKLSSRRFGLLFLFFADMVEKTLPCTFGGLPVVVDEISPL